VVVVINSRGLRGLNSPWFLLKIRQGTCDVNASRLIAMFTGRGDVTNFQCDFGFLASVQRMR